MKGQKGFVRANIFRSLTNPVGNEKGEAKATVESVDFSSQLKLET